MVLFLTRLLLSPPDHDHLVPASILSQPTGLEFSYELGASVFLVAGGDLGF